MTAMPINYFHDLPWWRRMANCNGFTDVAALDTSAKSDRSSIRHDKGGWPTTVSGTKATAHDAKAKLTKLMNSHDDSAWWPVGRGLRAAMDDERTKLLEDERNRTGNERKDIIECWDCTTTWLTTIRACINYRVCGEHERSRSFRYLTTTTLYVCNTPHYELQSWWRNSDYSSRTTDIKDRMPTCLQVDQDVTFSTYGGL